MSFRSTRIRSLFVLPHLILAMVLIAACGTDDTSPAASGSGEVDASQFIVQTDQVFAVDDLKSLGWKEQKELLLVYPESTDAKWGFYNTKELAILVYPSAAIAQVQGVEAALAQTAKGPDGKAIGEQDRISCRQAQGQSAVGLIEPEDTSDDSKAFHISFSPDTTVEQRVCANKFPTYADFRIVGNIVILCEGEGRTGDEPSKNCKDLPDQLQGK